MKGIIMTLIFVAVVWLFWMTGLAVIRTGKRYNRKRKGDKE
jgi:hypothetical protein